MEIFLKKHHLLTLATCKDNAPYCASCFYALEPKIGSFVIATESTTRHGHEAMENEKVAGAVALETSIIDKLQGIQFLGTYRPATKEEKKAYFARFPYAVAMNPTLWGIQIEWLKFTDNTLGFGKKIEWSREK